MTTYIPSPDVIMEYTTRNYSGELRWVVDNKTAEKKLQQKIVIISYEHGTAAGQKIDWIDVPTVTNDKEI